MIPVLKKGLPEYKSDHVGRLAERGHIALHVTENITGLLDKMDDPRILNNLREDGGTDFRHQRYQLYTIISATTLPPSHIPVRQNLFKRSPLFVGIDMENAKVKEFSVADGWTTYDKKNKHGRPSYKLNLTHFDVTLFKKLKSDWQLLIIIMNSLLF